MTDKPESALIDQYRRLRHLTVWVGLLALILVVVTAALGYQVQRRNRTIDRLDETVTRMEVTVTHAEQAADSARDLVQQALDAAASADNSATIDALRQIRVLYCLELPDDEICEATP